MQITSRRNIHHKNEIVDASDSESDVEDAYTETTNQKYASVYV